MGMPSMIKLQGKSAIMKAKRLPANAIDAMMTRYGTAHRI